MPGGFSGAMLARPAENRRIGEGIAVAGGNMARLPSIVALAAVLGLPLMLGGCVGAVVVGGLAAAAGGGYVAGQERGADGLASDFAITTDIRQALAKTDPKLDAAVTATVYEGRVLLTGQVPAPEMKLAAVRLARENRYVRAVHDEIEVTGNDTFWDDAKDGWISTQLRSEMVLDPDIRGVNYMIETENGSVYLIGSARTPRELERVTDIARRVRGVKRVVSYVELRSGAPVAAGGPIASGPTPLMPPPGPARPAAAPRTPIEVEKL
ncbi:MAG: BON domain-containing protein [Alphaproteobacteria bacterium]